ncbi:cytoplasmic dynein 1 light intermediate chain 1-like isoform X1 [Megalops cyprinoides]|uniref:cytoplasmic dynein 1 light intermediate chain 1-like isoform X1 n=1 Tax=Megalops cyprinoides TaxID=118141 RepID=UPI001864AFAF|nr:cytoplasmic dynein 1 light intermediate chain 1-like isoform X1 [Megalops cyprinoides]
MAAMGRNAPTSTNFNVNNTSLESQTTDDDDGKNLWSSILSEVSAHSRSKLPSGKNVLVMGEDGAGKTTLVAKLQGVQEYIKGRGLEYLYFSVNDDDIDDHTRCNAWILDGDLYHKGLQKFAVSQDSLADTIVLLVVDISRPWLALDSLQKWASVIREYIDKLKVAPEVMREMEQKLVRHFQEYVEPGSNLNISPQRRNPTAPDTEEEGIVLPLGDNTLTHNLGIPMVVVCTKCDAMSGLEKEHDYRDEHFDFIQSHIRRFCLQYGAALLYTSVKENKNLDVLYKYLVHRLYSFPFSLSAKVVEKDAVFIPSGWDNEKKIAILHENFQTIKMEDSFEDVIVKPPIRKFVHEKEIVAEDDQVFLLKLQSLLAKQPPVSAGRPVDTSNRGPSSSPRTTNRSAAANVANVMPMQSGGQTSEGVLANFFNSLLSKKTGSPGTGGTPVSGGGNTPGTVKKSGSKLGLTDVQAELDRISSKSELDNSSPTSPPTPPTEGEES